VAINDVGQILCLGWAGDDRRTRSFVLTPPSGRSTPDDAV